MSEHQNDNQENSYEKEENEPIIQSPDVNFSEEIENDESEFNFLSQDNCQNIESKSDPPTPIMNINLNSNGNVQNKEIFSKMNLKTIENTLPIPNEIIKPKNVLHITNSTVLVNLHNNKLDIKTIASKLRQKILSNGFLQMRVQNSNSVGHISENGMMSRSGTNSEEELLKTLKQYIKDIKKCNIKVSVYKEEIQIQNLAATYDLKFCVSLEKLYFYLRNLYLNVFFNSDSFPGLIYRKEIGESKGLGLSVFHSGKINFFGAKKKEHIYELFDEIYPVLLKFKIKKIIFKVVKN